MVYCVSDIHGNYAAFEDVLRNGCVNLQEDMLYILGDMIDWGKRSADVILKIKRMQEQHPQNVVVLIGNHEQMLLLSTQTQYARDLWHWNGGGQTEQQLVSKQCFDIVIEWIKTLPYQVKINRYLLCHAGPMPESVPEIERMRDLRTLIYGSQISYEEAQCVWQRVGYDDVDIPQGVVLVGGHTSTRHYHDSDDVYISENYINIDCGAKKITQKNGKLALLRLDDLKVWYSTKEDK